MFEDDYENERKTEIHVIFKEGMVYEEDGLMDKILDDFVDAGHYQTDRIGGNHYLIYSDNEEEDRDLADKVYLKWRNFIDTYEFYALVTKLEEYSNPEQAKESRVTEFLCPKCNTFLGWEDVDDEDGTERCECGTAVIKQ